MQQFTTIRIEKPDRGIARIVLQRPDKRNAQDLDMTYEIDAALKQTCQDDEIRAIILAGDGEHFCAGHDLSAARLDPEPGERLTLWGDYRGEGWEGAYSREHELYLDITERWRNAPKPLIAEVQGSVVAGGNMLVWACDIIICADDARFRDNTPDMAMPGAEFFAHPWELGIRKAKEWLFTTDWITAQEAERCGMVNHVVPRDRLSTFTLELARRISAKDRFTLKLIKESVNAAQDAMGRRQAMSTAFSLHQIGHMQNMLVHGLPIDISKLPPTIQQRLKDALASLDTAQPDSLG